MFAEWTGPEFIRREAGDLFIRSGAVFSTDLRHRFLLWRCWGQAAPWTFVMCNPSTADETVNDPTVAGCEKRARLAGAGGLVVVNLFALRSTDPRGLRHCLLPDGKPDLSRPVSSLERVGGQANDRAILEAARLGSVVIAAWGTYGQLDDRGQAVRTLLQGDGILPSYLRQTLHGHPEHPLYVPHAIKPQLWRQP